MLYLVFNQLMVLMWEWGFDAWTRRSIRKRLLATLGSRDYIPPARHGLLMRTWDWVVSSVRPKKAEPKFTRLQETSIKDSHFKHPQYLLDALVSSLLVERKKKNFTPLNNKLFYFEKANKLLLTLIFCFSLINI
jgi:hypothetical protein